MPRQLPFSFSQVPCTRTTGIGWLALLQPGTSAPGGGDSGAVEPIALEVAKLWLTGRPAAAAGGTGKTRAVAAAAARALHSRRLVNAVSLLARYPPRRPADGIRRPSTGAPGHSC